MAVIFAGKSSCISRSANSTNLFLSKSCHRQHLANIANRCYYLDMTTTFVPKGRKPKQPNKVRERIKSSLRTTRAAHMEGAIGNEKEHYGLRKVKARRPDTQQLWVCFGVWTASAMKISKRMALASLAQAA